MRPKGKLFALFAVFAAIGLVTASGAFTTVTADRTAEVDTAGDANALLAIDTTDSPNANDYVSDSSDTIEIRLVEQGADGLNNNATTEVDDLLNITNQGSQEVSIYIERTGDDHSEAVTFYSGDASTGTNITTSGQQDEVTLTPGTGTNISMTVDTNGKDIDNDEELLSDITIHANATS